MSRRCVAHAGRYPGAGAGRLHAGAQPGHRRAAVHLAVARRRRRQLGREEHPKALAQFGGHYPDRDAEAYVERVGNRVKNASELKDQPFTFTLLDSDVVNAFALPGGYVYVTRGLLALTNNEAELAGVLGHEIGHVTARHTAQRYDRAQAGQIWARPRRSSRVPLLGGLLGGSEGAQLGGRARPARRARWGPQAYVQGYSREQEFQADQLGIRYLARRRLRSRRHGDLPGDAAGRRRLPSSAWPDAGRRARATFWATGSAAIRARPSGSRGRWPPASAAMPAARRDRPPDLLAGVDGMLYGEDPAQGVVRGRSFQHPELRIAFEAPPGFKLQNSPTRWWARTGRGRPWCSTWPPRTWPAICAAICRAAGSPSSSCRTCRASTLAASRAAVGFGQVTHRRPAGAGHVQRRCAGRTGGSTASCSRTRAASAGPTSPRSSRACAASGRCRPPRRRR